MSDNPTREQRVEAYFDLSARSLAEALVKTEDRIDNLRLRVRKLNALEAAGVDNWEGYDAAVESIDG